MNHSKKSLLVTLSGLGLLIGLLFAAAFATSVTTGSVTFEPETAVRLVAGQEDKTFSKPRWRDQRLDWCLNWGTDCGQPAADRFCQRRRFTGARDFRAEPNIGSTQPTRLMGSDQVCNEPFCTGFDYITCYGPLTPDQIFAPPVLDETRLDVCVTFGKDCGKPAADAFCKAQGFSDAIYFQADSGVGTQPTRLIGTGEICKDKFCTAFEIITCRDYAHKVGRDRGSAPRPTP